jgi:hypothetical protein
VWMAKVWQSDLPDFGTLLRTIRKREKLGCAPTEWEGDGTGLISRCGNGEGSLLSRKPFRNF